MTPARRKRVEELVAEYLGLDPVWMDAVEDPEVEGTVAVRVRGLAEGCDCDYCVADFLIVDVDRATADDVEEVEFSEWPPVKGDIV